MLRDQTKLMRVRFYKELKHGRPDGESLKAVLQPIAGDDDKGAPGTFSTGRFLARHWRHSTGDR